MSSIGKIVKNNEELKDLLKTPSWRLLDLIEETNDSNIPQVNRKTLTRILKLSGLDTNISEEREKSLLQSLNLQMRFIKNLYEDTDAYNPKEESNEYTFRLLESDHKEAEPLTLEKLLGEIESLSGKVDKEKGEVPEGFKIGQLSTESRDSGATVIKINLRQD